MKQFDPFLINRGMKFAEKLFDEPGRATMYKDERTLVTSRHRKRIAVYVTARDYGKTKQSAMIHEDNDYITIKRFFDSYNADQNYVLIVFGVRDGLRYDPAESYFILVPDETIQRVYLRRQVTINIGVTDKQRSTWEPEGVKYFTMMGKVWGIPNSIVYHEDAKGGRQNWSVRFSKEESAILTQFGLQEHQWFSMSTTCMDEGDHYIGLGKTNSLSYTRNGVYYRVTRGSALHTVQPLSKHVNGLKFNVNWSVLTMNESKLDPKQLLLVRAIEAGWFSGYDSLTPDDFEAPDKPPQEPLEWDFNGQHMAEYRKEQVELRKRLLKGRTEAPCAICGDVYPEDMLWAAHIKKRSECSLSEKGDLDHIAALMCKMGCDDLFEKGYLSIQKGKVEILRSTSSKAVQNRLDLLMGRSCLAWRAETAKYFEWHHSFFMGKS